MSFAEKMAGIMARPNQDAIPKDDVSWVLKYAARVLVCILFGLTNCLGIITIDIPQVLSGILQMLIGFFVMVVEAPCCCMFIDFVQQIAEKADQRPYWNRAALYCGLAIVPIIIKFGLASVFACGLVFLTGVLYGMMSLGKKGGLRDPNGVASPYAMSPGQGQPPMTDQHSTLMEDPD
ncbi:Calcium channel flower, partial [Pseudolycoriella hygida]